MNVRRWPLLVLLLVLLLPACAAPPPQPEPALPPPLTSGQPDRFAAHFRAETWTGAVAQQAERPQQWIPELALLAATPIARHEDHPWSVELARDASLTQSSTRRGDAVGVGMTVAALGLAGADWIGGDDGQSAEVLLESFVLTEGVTEIVKRTVRRPRPEGGRSSFPSGHMSYATCMATFLARSIDDEYGSPLGYLAFLPAAYVGIDRIEARRHYPSDIVFGAFLGFTLTNLVYDAHRGDAQHRGIYAARTGPSWFVEPAVAKDRIELAFVLQF